jgi:hypothetical protein
MNGLGLRRRDRVHRHRVERIARGASCRRAVSLRGDERNGMWYERARCCRRGRRYRTTRYVRSAMLVSRI